MLDQLRIKCPSCGIILDVRNSKHEALKQIVCPNCKKQLAVNFEEELEPTAPPQPIEPLYYGEMRIDLQEGINQIPLADCNHVEIKVVRLKDGGSKCMVRPLSESHPVKVNNQQLQADEQVVLTNGDQLQVGNTVMTFSKVGSRETLPPEPPEPFKPDNPQNGGKRIWINAALACIALMLLTILIWPSDKKGSEPNNQVAQIMDTIRRADTISEPKTKVDSNKEKRQITVSGEQVDKTEKTNDLNRLSDYDLEKLALGGNVEAQYLLGSRLSHGKGPNTVLRGIKYLRMAANNGSSDAKKVLSKAITALQQKAENGDSIAYYILMSINK